MQRQRFDPDIQVKYHQIIAHMNEKNKVIQQFSKILKQLCDWEMFNSRNLDKFANSISKLLIGKDPLKDTFILFQRILASKSDQANKIAVSIKEDMLPFLQNAINIKDQSTIKSQQFLMRQVRTNMQQKVRQLYSAQVNYKNTCQKMKTFSQPSNLQSRQKIQELKKIKREVLDAQTYLTQMINIYNHNVEDYMLNYTKLCEQLSQIQSNRKTTIKQSISKYIVFEMDAIKNIEYDLSRYAKSIQKMEDKLVLQDKVVHNPQTKAIQLAKISPHNYIMHLTERESKDDNFQTQTHKKLNQIKKFLDPSFKKSYEIDRYSFKNIVQDINELLNEAAQVYDIKMVKQIVHYVGDFYMLSTIPTRNNENNSEMIFRRAKIPLIKAVLCHQIFKNQSFWAKYSSRLSDIVQRELSINKGFKQSDQIKISLSFLSADIEFMKKISSSPIVQKILQKYQKYNSSSSQNIIKSTDSIKSRSKTQKIIQEQKQKVQPFFAEDAHLYF